MTSGLSPSLAHHVEGTVRLWLGLPGDADVPALPPSLARRFLRLEELERSHRDQWGNWEFGFSESFRDGALLVPEVDHWVAAERRRLSNAGVALADLWPDGKKFAVCLTHDVDLVSTTSTPSQVARSMRMSLAREPGSSVPRNVLRFARPPVRLARAARHGIGLAPSTSTTLERCVSIEQEAGVTASYFFTVPPPHQAHRYDCVYGLGDTCTFRGKRKRISQVLQELAEDGFDVGLHGSYHSAVEPGLLAEQRDALERATDLEVTTTRQHFLHWDIRKTPRLQAEAGLLADTTLGFNRAVGFRAGTSLPFAHFDHERDSALELLQIPLIVEDGPLFRSDGLELDREMADVLVHSVLDTVAAGGGVATFLFHPNSLVSDDHLSIFRSTIAYAQSLGAWFASTRAIESWWRNRAASLAPS